MLVTHRICSQPSSRRSVSVSLASSTDSTESKPCVPKFAATSAGTCGNGGGAGGRARTQRWRHKGSGPHWREKRGDKLTPSRPSHCSSVSAPFGGLLDPACMVRFAVGRHRQTAPAVCRRPPALPDLLFTQDAY